MGRNWKGRGKQTNKRSRSATAGGEGGGASCGASSGSDEQPLKLNSPSSCMQQQQPDGAQLIQMEEESKQQQEQAQVKDEQQTKMEVASSAGVETPASSSAAAAAAASSSLSAAAAAASSVSSSSSRSYLMSHLPARFASNIELRASNGGGASASPVLASLASPLGQSSSSQLQSQPPPLSLEVLWRNEEAERRSERQQIDRRFRAQAEQQQELLQSMGSLTTALITLQSQVDKMENANKAAARVEEQRSTAIAQLEERMQALESSKATDKLEVAPQQLDALKFQLEQDKKLERKEAADEIASLKEQLEQRSTQHEQRLSRLREEHEQSISSQASQYSKLYEAFASTKTMCTLVQTNQLASVGPHWNQSDS